MANPPSRRFKEIKRHHLGEGSLFEDHEFPAEESSLDPQMDPTLRRGIVWKRPHEIVANPKMFIDEASQLDICQGMLGDCWLLASIASLTLDPYHLHTVVPDDQDFDKEDYCGVFRFNFWQFGEWKEVIIDDRLPTYRNQLVFVHSQERGEMWSALLEKAYAKLFKSYGALKGGQIGEALADFTGGIPEEEALDGKVQPEDLFKRMLKAVKRNHLMGCSVDATPGKIEEKMDNGLVKGHAYSITGVAQVHVHGQAIPMVRIRNPWGNEREWKGAWSDGSDEWNMVSDEEKREIGLTYDDDGEFWMSFNDFYREFSRVTICHKEGSKDSETNTTFNLTSSDGTWVRRVTAGGCRNFPETFGTNPQFRVTLQDTDEDDDDVCTMIVALMQKRARGFANPALTIGFMIYPITDKAEQFKVEGDRLDKKYFLYTKSAGKSKSFVNAREIVQRFTLPPGEYCIVPSTFQPNEEGEFFIRLLTEAPGNKGDELKTELSMEGASTDSNHSYSSENQSLIQKLKSFFSDLAGEDDVISPKELHQMLRMITEEGHEEPDVSHVYALMSLFDKDLSGKLDFYEFLDLYRFIKSCEKAFEANSDEGKATPLELETALREMKVKMPRKLLAVATSRYGDKDSNVSFLDFMAIVCKVKSVMGLCAQDSSGVPMNVLEKLLGTTLMM